MTSEEHLIEIINLFTHFMEGNITESELTSYLAKQPWYAIDKIPESELKANVVKLKRAIEDGEAFTIGGC